MRSVVLLLCVSFSAGCLFDGGGFIPPGVDTRITFLHTADIHSRLVPFELAPTASDKNLGLDEANAPFGGAARLAYLLRRERARADRVLHIDSGDCFQGAPIFNQNTGEAELRFLSNIGLDAAVIGNHEFDAGVWNLAEKLEAWATFDVLAANYVFPDPDNPNHHNLGNLAKPYSLFNVKGLKVAVIGMANLGSLTSIGEGGNSMQITPLEQNETVRSYVQLLHGSVDLIVVVSHLGLTEDEELVRGYEKVVWKDRMAPGWSIVEEYGDGRVLAHIPGVSDIDIILGGHLHVVLNPPKLIRDADGREVIICHSGAFAKYLGRLDVVLEDDNERGGKRVVSHKYQVFPVDDRLRDYEDQSTARLIEPYIVDLNRALDLGRVIAYAPQDIRRRSETGNGDSGLGNLVAESMRSRRRVAAEFAVTNTLGIRDNFYRGAITLEDMYNVFPFENTLTVMYLSGSEVQEMVDFISERSASRGCQSQAQVAGITFTMNCGQVLQNERHPDAYVNPGEDIFVNGAPLSPTASYKVATNDYIAKGGSGFRVLKRNTSKVDTGVPLRSALIDYLGTLPVCGDYEIETGRYCYGADDFSKSVCRELVDCNKYAAKYLSSCTAEAIAQMPPVCREVLEEGSCRLSRSIKGAYADTPCVVGREDGRIKRKTAEDLDQITDPTGGGQE